MEYTRPFSYGTCGADVRAFQTNLVTLGYELPRYGVDGCYGEETENASKACCQVEHWDFCSWGLMDGEPPLPVWLQEWVQTEADKIPSTCWTPTGRGMWIQSMNTLSGPDEAERIVNTVGLSFVIVQAHWQYGDQASYQYNWPDSFNGLEVRYGGTKGKPVIEQFRKMGVEVIPFSYPVPGKHEEVIDILNQFRDAWGSPSVIIDPEAEWKSSSGRHDQAALDLAAALNDSFDSWGMSTYGACWYHRSFPYKQFSTADYGLPQTYSTEPFGTIDKMTRAMDEWHEYGYQQLVNLYGTYSKTDEEMRAYLEVVNAMNPTATAGWKWGSTSDPEWDHIDNILPG